MNIVYIVNDRWCYNTGEQTEVKTRQFTDDLRSVGCEENFLSVKLSGSRIETRNFVVFRGVNL